MKKITNWIVNLFCKEVSASQIKKGDVVIGDVPLDKIKENIDSFYKETHEPEVMREKTLHSMEVYKESLKKGD